MVYSHVSFSYRGENDIRFVIKNILFILKINIYIYIYIYIFKYKILINLFIIINRCSFENLQGLKSGLIEQLILLQMIIHDEYN